MKCLIPIVTLLGLLMQSCGSGSTPAPTSTTNPKGVYVSTQNYTFASRVDPATLTYNGQTATSIINGTSYVINNTNDLYAINQNASSTIFANYQPISINDLGTYSYYFIKAAGCPFYSEYSGVELSGGDSLSIKLNVFTLGNISCPQIVGINYYHVFKATKVL